MAIGFSTYTGFPAFKAARVYTSCCSGGVASYCDEDLDALIEEANPDWRDLAEELGFDSVWMSEAYGSDCFTPLAWWGSTTERLKLGTAITQISARTPAT